MNWECDGVVKCECAIIFRVNEEFGGLSNMSNQFPLEVNGISIKSTEALYQACRYPHEPEWQQEILNAPHAMRAKMVSKKNGRRTHSREDWQAVQVEVMRWCLRLKLEQHFGEYFNLLQSTGQRPIVERSRSDRFWGAVLDSTDVLRGYNQLGRLLVGLREEAVAWMNGEDEDEEWPAAVPPQICNFRLLGQQLE